MRLWFREIGFLATGFEYPNVRPGVAGDALFQGFHFAEHFLALFPAVRATGFGGHLHAQGVHFTEEFQRLLWHAVLQPVLADQGGGFHQGAGGVAQQDPVDGEVDVGFHTGAVEIDIIETDGF